MTLRRFFLLLYTLVAAQFLMAQVVFAMGSDTNSTEAEKPAAAADPDYENGKNLIEKEDWNAAILSFTKVVKRDPSDADAFNFMGYAYRQLGNYEKAFASYKQALAIYPKHKGANEYIGEAYLQIGDLAKAEEHLSVLDNVCTFGCAEYTMLKRAVSDYKKNKS